MIIPWNFPLLLTVWKLAPALAAGCVAVIKPSELTPLTALKLGALCLEAGLPSGVCERGARARGSVAGQALLEARGVDKIAFTGSTEVGRTVMKSAAGTIKRVSLELGGKSPNIVFADAKLDAAANGACSGIFYNKGEVCAAGSRLFVEKKVHDEFVDMVKAKMARYTPGDPLDDKTRLGPQVSKAHRDSILKRHRRRHARRRQDGHRRARDQRQRARVLSRTDRADRCHQFDDGGARGDLRARVECNSFRRRERSGQAGQ